MRVLLVLCLISTAWGAEPAPAATAVPSPPAQSQAKVGTLVLSPEVTQPVMITNGATQRMAINGDPVYLEDHVVTSATQSAMIRLTDQTELTAGPSTNLTVTQFSNQPNEHQAQINLDQGIVHAAVVKKTYDGKHPFLIRTKTAAMGVRGTEFLAELLPSGETSLHTLEGSVALGKSPADLNSSKNSALVNAGRTSSMELGSVRPKPPKRFNRKTLMEHLGNRSPDLIKQIDHWAQIHQQKSAVSREKKSGKKSRRATWKNSNLRRQIGHH